MNGRVRTVPVSLSLLDELLFRGGFQECRMLTSDAPSDAHILAIRPHQYQWNVVELTVESDAFDEVPNGSVPPEWTPIFHSTTYGHVSPAEKVGT